MLPTDLTAATFAAYPPKAKQLAIANLVLLQQLPIALVALLLKEVRAYDWKFPAEQKEVDNQFAYLRSLSADDLHLSMARFAGITVPPDVANLDWINSPEIFAQRFSGMLWATNQIPPFRATSIQYVNAYKAVYPAKPAPMPRLTIVAVGSGVKENTYPLFRALRPHGVYYTNAAMPGGVPKLLEIVAARSKAHPAPFTHWYVDGGAEVPAPDTGIACVSYTALNPLRLAVLKRMRSMGQTVRGPEGMQESLGEIRPEQFGATGHSENPVLDHFQLSVFTEGSGTQIYSTTFVQWTAHELLRRAEPLTAFLRFAPRQTQRSMDELLADEGEIPTMDPQGALVDADMGAYYIWLNQRRLANSDQASFLVWFEDHKEAVMISPKHAPGTVSHESVSLDKMLATIA
jgi:hypothetical protein